MKIPARWISAITVLSLALLLCITVGLPVVQGSADHVRWDIVNFDPTTTPATASAGGVAFAFARNPGTNTIMRIKLTGNGTFVAPASGGTSSAVTGGGTWETFNDPDSDSDFHSTGSGTYEVRELISWQLANLQAAPLTDLIDDGTRANGNAVLRIVYDDGSEGVLGVGCHGASALPGILEGVIATKGFVTYWDAQAPMPGVNANRTLFHIE